MQKTKVLGIDLAAKDGNPTGFCLIMGNEVLAVGEFKAISSLFEYINILHPDIVAIDSPLNFPRVGGYRDCDLMLRKRGLRPLPISMESMRLLVNRAIYLVGRLKKLGIRYIETFPAGSLRLLGYKRKPRSYSERKKYFLEISRRYGLSGAKWSDKLSKDEFDAFLCALAGYCYMNGNYISVAGGGCEIVFPYY